MALPSPLLPAVVALAAATLGGAPAIAQCDHPWFPLRQIERRFDRMTGIELNGAGLAELVGQVDGIALEVWSFDGGLTPTKQALMDGDVGMAFAPADFDGDGDLDLAVHRRSTATLATLLNTGSGLAEAFAAPAADGLACALDFDGDGDVDVALAQPGQVSVMLNGGGGSFTPGPSLALGGGADEIVPASLDGDGRADLLVYASIDATLTVAPLRQTAGGGLEALPLYPARFRDAADVDADGDTDFVYAPMHLARCNGDGTFAPGVELAPDYDEPLHLADLDGDGDADLVANSLEYAMRILLNDGTGAFAQVPPDAGRPGAWGPVITPDMNGDGAPDLVTDRNLLTDVRMGRGDGTFESNAFVPVFEELIRRIALADLDNDGDLDVLAVGDQRTGAGLAALVNDGGAGLAVSAFAPLSSGGYEAPVAADFDGDGDTDAALISQDSITLFENTPADPFATRHEIPFEYDATVGLVLFGRDLDHDGRMDLVTLGREARYGIRSFLNRGGWVFESAFSEIYPFGLVTAVDDFDGDGEVDAVVNDDSGGELGFCYGLGGGAFTPPHELGDGMPRDEFHGYTADLNADGAPELLLQEIAYDHLYVVGNDGFGGLYWSQEIRGYDQARCVGVGDLDGDGVDDVALGSSDPWGDAGAFVSRDGGWLEGPIRFTPGYRAVRGTLIADMNGDGRNDIVAATDLEHNAVGGVCVVLNPCAAPPCAGDFNGDGATDTIDFIAFLNAWAQQRDQDCSSGGCSADFNGDGDVDTLDFIAYLNAWVQGC
ncbi:MAG TPA: FG-GAP-like repeat-containing protein [Phycisphaerales bacterium]|nr:FG-GAP-like repeat-containing protein [Phycisphaerales bacterium]